MAGNCWWRMAPAAGQTGENRCSGEFDMEDLSLHVLDIAENSIAAGASSVVIRVRESRQENVLVIEIADNGGGMSREALGKATDPFWSTRTTRRVGVVAN